jgi:hypothetical protein
MHRKCPIPAGLSEGMKKEQGDRRYKQKNRKNNPAPAREPQKDEKTRVIEQQGRQGRRYYPPVGKGQTG